MTQHIMTTVYELLGKCKVVQGFTTNSRHYNYKGKTILEHNVKSKNVWIQDEMKKHVDYAESTIEKLAVQWFDGKAKKAFFSDVSDIRDDLLDGFERAIDTYVSSTSKLPDITLPKILLPTAAANIIEGLITKRSVKN